MTLDMAYVGNQGHHIFRDIDANPPQPALVAQLLAACDGDAVTNAQWTVPPTCVSRESPALGICIPVLEFGSLPFDAVAHNAIGRGGAGSAVLIDSGGNAEYDSLQLKVTKRLQYGLQLQGAYTWSHSIDDANDPIIAAGAGVNFVRNPLDPSQDRGNSDHDIRHIGVINYIWEMPFGRGKAYANHGIVGRILEGFQLSGVTSLQTGRAFDVIGTRDSLRVGRVGRASLNGDPFASSGASFVPGTKVFFTNPAAFSNPPFDQAPSLGTQFLPRSRLREL